MGNGCWDGLARVIADSARAATVLLRRQVCGVGDVWVIGCVERCDILLRVDALPQRSLAMVRLLTFCGGTCRLLRTASEPLDQPAAPRARSSPSKPARIHIHSLHLVPREVGIVLLDLDERHFEVCGGVFGGWGTSRFKQGRAAASLPRPGWSLRGWLRLSAPRSLPLSLSRAGPLLTLPLPLPGAWPSAGHGRKLSRPRLGFKNFDRSERSRSSSSQQGGPQLHQPRTWIAYRWLRYNMYRASSKPADKQH